MNNSTDVKRQSDEEEAPTRAENVVVSVKSVWAIVVGVIAVGGFVLRLSFQVDQLQIQQSAMADKFEKAMAAVSLKLTELDRVTKVEAKVDALKENGSDNVKNLRDEFSRLRHDFDVHVAETVGRPSK